MILAQQTHQNKRLTAIILALLLFFITIGCDKTKGDLQLIPAAPEKGFNFPYYLFLPKEGLQNDRVTFIIEPNNTGTPSDNFDTHIDAAKQQARSSQIGNFLSHKLKYPLLVPVFTRSSEHWKIYTHALDRDALEQKGNDIERLDLQLVAMFEDAKVKLNQMGHTLDDTFIMTGFSACASFTNRFTALHPQRVKASIAGGLNGMLILPTSKVKEQLLPYPIGIQDVQDLVGHSFDTTSFVKTPQFLFMGADDDNDAALYDDAYTDTERDLIYAVLGKTMLPDRWKFCTDKYKKLNVQATMRLYENTGHEITKEIQEDIMSFITKVTTNKVN